MVAAECAMVAFFAEQLSAHVIRESLFDRHYWWPFRKQAINNTPNIRHDVTALRLATYHLGIQALGVKQTKAKQMAQQALDYFLAQRSDFTVPQSSHQLLQKLAAKFPLIAISNGNVDLKKIGLSQYFQASYLAGDGLLMKPDSDMFIRATHALNISPANLLHVGDCGRADILGALSSGVQAAWLSGYDVGKPISVLPHFEITNIEQLLDLV